ncbi:phosphoglycerate dehydrogenase [Companilactobacillus sp.]|jgi:D-3-phosphoglycerate dehydrogenase|uniref:phosphoglycerate dehydrogenase n=1 Tax=Companilactobacillus sp. TaxID=2767905 RepID=UPI0025BFD5A9|nr:phosphoglycerate dehydrogenase [Companilactobacillus sp.]MCH4009887.1 phosphoglycerate dehydrogenase [Companilactobacillus sp.]MCH4052437.1 phosphoglycerate dehydrogenase [Companilactobacillus sp.]MCH4077829.1 phosphoglycerate dehydrogenase [Companilactobacillus sp.]MCH4126405.1 phosphoglycerate dehydrogenase [Companilactobacillus sp.]MCI1312727.1 phosphoglycerate dehydrogenase [Companilactobacillus sp.]
MFQVKTFNAIAKTGLETFDDNFKINQSEDPDAYLIRSVNLLAAEFPESLKTIVRCGVGYNNVPLKRATEKGIAVFNTPGSNANAVKELIIALMIATARNLFAANAYSNQHTEADISQRTEKDKTKFNGTELAGKRLAVIGLGNVGSRVANAALALGMKVVGYDPYLSANAAWRIDNKVKRAGSIRRAVKNADFVTIHVPKNDETVGLFSTTEITAMKDKAVLFNYSRIGIADNKAVVEAVKSGKIAHYCTDFGEPVIADQPNVTITPHIGGSTLEAESNGAVQGANTVMNYLKSGDTKNSVNLPNMTVPFEAPYRVTVIHQNVPNMVGQIATAMAERDINIENMANAAKEKTAYTVVDVNSIDGDEGRDLVEALNAIKEVYRVRIIEHQ